MENVIVTRHPALVEYLRDLGVEAPMIQHATSKDVKGKHVYGVLPLHLAVYAGLITEIPLSLPVELRGKELTLEQVKKYAGKPATYAVLPGKPRPCDCGWGITAEWSDVDPLEMAQKAGL